MEPLSLRSPALGGRFFTAEPPEILEDREGKAENTEDHKAKEVYILMRQSVIKMKSSVQKVEW